MKKILTVVVCVLLLTGVAACGSDVDVSYDDGDPDALVIYAGAGDDREILTHVVDDLLPSTVHVTLRDAPSDANQKIADGDGDLAFYQHIPAFDADQEQHRLTNLSIVSKVNVIPYGLYSPKWKNLDETQSWVNTGLVADEITGTSLPHGSRIALPNTPTGFARGLYLLASRGLVTLDRPFGGTTAADLTIDQAHVLDSARHLSLLGIDYGDYLRSIYDGYDAVVLSPEQAQSIGLTPQDALALEPGPDNPYAHVLVAPSRLARDARVVELTRALESPQLAEYLTTRYRGANIAVDSAARR